MPNTTRPLCVPSAPLGRHTRDGLLGKQIRPQVLKICVVRSSGF